MIAYPQRPEPVSCEDMLADPDSCPREVYYAEVVEAYALAVERLVDETNKPDPTPPAKPSAAECKAWFFKGIDAAARHLKAANRPKSVEIALRAKGTYVDESSAR